MVNKLKTKLLDRSYDIIETHAILLNFSHLFRKLQNIISYFEKSEKPHDFILVLLEAQKRKTVVNI